MATDIVQELTEQHIPRGFLAYIIRCNGIIRRVCDVSVAGLPDPFAKDVAKAGYPGALLVLAVLELGQQVVPV